MALFHAGLQFPYLRGIDVEVRLRRMGSRNQKIDYSRCQSMSTNDARGSTLVFGGGLFTQDVVDDLFGGLLRLGSGKIDIDGDTCRKQHQTDEQTGGANQFH